jgi:hypothetical protein
MSKSQSTTRVEYRPITGFPGYRIGSDGTVWSCLQRRRLGPSGGSTTEISDTWHKLRPSYSNIYPQVNLRKVTRRIHCLVAEAFIGPRPNGLQVCHNNSNKRDCRASNLRYDTPSGNEQDKRENGTYQLGEKNPFAKLTVDLVREIRQRVSVGERIVSVCRSLNLPTSTVHNVVKRNSWKHVA